METLTKYNKFWIAVLGAVAQIVVLSFPESQYAQVASSTLAVLTALGVYVVPNKKGIV